MNTVGSTEIKLRVWIGDYEGELASINELRPELTEALWLSSRIITVLLRPSSSDDGPWLVLNLAPEPALRVTYNEGTPQTRETLRVLVERALPLERLDPRRHWRWLGPIVGCALYATDWLIRTRISIHGFHFRESRAAKDTLLAVPAILLIALSTYWTRLVFRRLFPPLERLPDTAVSRWDRWQMWVGVGVSIWVAVVIGLLALPVRT